MYTVLIATALPKRVTVNCTSGFCQIIFYILTTMHEILIWINQ